MTVIVMVALTVVSISVFKHIHEVQGPYRSPEKPDFLFISTFLI